MVGTDEVTVAAGKFQTLRVEWKSEFMGQPVRGNIWLAPGRGIVKQHFTIGKDETQLELKSFTPGKK